MKENKLSKRVGAKVLTDLADSSEVSCVFGSVDGLSRLGRRGRAALLDDSLNKSVNLAEVVRKELRIEGVSSFEQLVEAKDELLQLQLDILTADQFLKSYKGNAIGTFMIEVQ